MKTRSLIILLVLAIGTLGAKEKDPDKERGKAERKAEKLASKNAAAPPATGAPASATGYDVFRNVKLKNIFDPTRRGLRSEGTVATTAEAVKRGRSLSLTGTMVTEGKALAFFGGSAAEGNRVVSAGNSVAGYKVGAIGATQVALEREGRQLVLQVGRQLTFEADGATGAADPVVEKAPEPVAEATGVPSLPGVSADKADLLRKMMERRARETAK